MSLKSLLAVGFTLLSFKCFALSSSTGNQSGNPSYKVLAIGCKDAAGFALIDLNKEGPFTANPGKLARVTLIYRDGEEQATYDVSYLVDGTAQGTQKLFSEVSKQEVNLVDSRTGVVESPNDFHFPSGNQEVGECSFNEIQRLN